MSSLGQIDIDMILDLFEGSRGRGYVLEFSDRSFSTFMRDLAAVDIDAPRYRADGNSKGRRLRTFLATASEPTIVKVLNGLWQYRVRFAEEGRYAPVPDEGERLSQVIRSLHGSPLKGMGRAQKSPVKADTAHAGPSARRVGELLEEFRAIMALEPQPRGYAFESFLKALFDTWGMQARRGWRNTGEQIDGSFLLGEEVYLVEAKWQQAQSNAAALHAFQGKLEAGPGWTRGLFVSYSGFTLEALEAFVSRRVILMDGFDLHEILDRGLSVRAVLSEKVRRFSETRRPYVQVRELFPS